MIRNMNIEERRAALDRAKSANVPSSDLEIAQQRLHVRNREVARRRFEEEVERARRRERSRWSSIVKSSTACGWR